MKILQTNPHNSLLPSIYSSNGLYFINIFLNVYFLYLSLIVIIYFLAFFHNGLRMNNLFPSTFNSCKYFYAIYFFQLDYNFEWFSIFAFHLWFMFAPCMQFRNSHLLNQTIHVQTLLANLVNKQSQSSPNFSRFNFYILICSKWQLRNIIHELEHREDHYIPYDPVVIHPSSIAFTSCAILY